jgi:hypothetical protein
MIFLPHVAPSHGTSRAPFEGDPALPKSMAIGISLLALFVIGVSLILLGLA